MRALGLRPDGGPWTIAVEKPDPTSRAPHSMLVLQDAAVATSGDYRHWVDVGGRRLSYTMDPRRGARLTTSPVSVTVVARTCAEADAWATALMVLGPGEGAELARRLRLDALFLTREGGPRRSVPCSQLARSASRPLMLANLRGCRDRSAPLLLRAFAAGAWVRCMPPGRDARGSRRSRERRASGCAARLHPVIIQYMLSYNDWC